MKYLQHAAAAFVELFAADGAAVIDEAAKGETLPQGSTPVLTRSEIGWGVGSIPIRIPAVVSDVQRERLPVELSEQLAKFTLKSWMAVSSSSGRTYAEIWFRHGFVRLRKEDVAFVRLALDEIELIKTEGREDFESAEYNRLVKYGRVSVVKTDASFNVVAVSGGVIEALGVLPEDLFKPDAFKSVVAVEDYRRLARKIKRLVRDPREFTEEVRITHPNGSLHWLLVRLYPILSANRQLEGWEAIGFDVTDKKEAEGALVVQNRRVQALYEVSRALQSVADPTLVAEQGLNAMIRATGSAGGMVFFYSGSTDALELVSHAGVSASYVAGVKDVLKGGSLVRHCIQSKTAVLVGDIQHDDRAARILAESEGLRATIVAPLIVEDSVLGALLLSCREADRYNEEDLDLVKAAANQMALVVRQAEYYAAERKQASSFATLYRLSHELSKHYSVREMAEHAFPIIHNELPCKRMWLGVINEQGTHLVGQAGFGMGIRKKLIDMQIDLSESRPFLDEVISQHIPVVAEISDADVCEGLEGVMHRLGAKLLILVPLISIGKVIGVLCLEPIAGNAQLFQRRLPLLASMANEMGVAITTRAFEARLANASKMRMATMLAAGVAHNFNNLLQAVMGQASLLDIQLPAGSQQQQSAKQIVEAANRGAALVRQLLTVSKGDSGERSKIMLGSFLKNSEELYRSLLGDSIALKLKMTDSSAEILVDQPQLQQVMTNLLVNAKEALQNSAHRSVTITAGQVNLGPSEVDPELPPGVYARIDVSDTGPGMDAEKQLRCFEPFFSTKEGDSVTGLNYGGAGLGLSSAYSIVKAHDGLITVQSEVGKGATFSIFVPVIAKRSSTRGVSEVGTRQVLILGLPDGVSQMMRRTVESAGFNAIVTSDENDAKRLMRGDSAELALLVVAAERRSPSMLRFVRNIMQEGRKFAVMVVTSNPSRWRKLVRGMGELVVTEKQQQLRALTEMLTSLSQRISLKDRVQVSSDGNGNGAVPREGLSGAADDKKA